MFVKKEKYEKVQAQLKAMQDRRAALYSALDLGDYVPEEDITEFDPENNEDPVLVSLQDFVTAIDNAEKEIQTAQEEKTTAEETAENSIKEVTTDLNDLGADVKSAKTLSEKMATVRTKLAEKPGSGQTAANIKEDTIEMKENGVDQETIDNLAHNVEADEALGV